ncbi:uncharacterized protein LOC108038005 [Drosophila rhopaloa]|uniref:Uncharacterized protein LOC108038005 n=1 Tax=Drosophila rhopaloa TaxID=1041015 RepID=A0A6P4E1B3_DRORH|nr:uncharacterized protein LOC108038005 [Drosophila rhopaloa]
MHPAQQLNFKIQLLSGKNVVLVDCSGYESELFMPQIVRGRITFQNIIPDRRCCPESRMLSDPLQVDLGTRTRTMRSPLRRTFPEVNLSTPLAKSTPSSTSSLRSKAGKENELPQLTPEGPRTRPFELTSLVEVEMDIDPVNVTPCQEQAYTTLRLPSPELQLPAVYQNESLSVPRISPQNLSSFKQGTVLTKEPVIHNSTPKLPPRRTYTRKKPGNPCKTKPAPAWSPLKKNKKNPTVSSTKVPNPTMKLEVRNRKLIVDPKTTLAAYDPNQKESVTITKKKIIRKQVTGKTRKQFEALKVTAFDLLTNSSVGHMSRHLNKHFQKSCVNKMSTTLPSYAEIAVAAPLVMDRQVKALVAAQKRMERITQRPKGFMTRKSKQI